MKNKTVTSTFNYMNSLSKYLKKIKDEGDERHDYFKKIPSSLRKSMEEYDDIEFEIINIKAVIKDKSKNKEEKTQNYSTLELHNDQRNEKGRHNRASLKMRNEDESNRTSTDINFKYTSQNKDGINGGKYVPTRIQFMVKNESILVPEDTETDISVTKNKDKLELSSLDNTETQDDNEYTPHVYSPNRKLYRDRCMHERKLDYFLKSAERMTSQKRKVKRN